MKFDYEKLLEYKKRCNMYLEEYEEYKEKGYVSKEIQRDIRKHERKHYIEIVYGDGMLGWIMKLVYGVKK